MPHGPGRRLPGFDYSRPGAYFITIVVEGRRGVLARLDDNASDPTAAGRCVLHAWQTVVSRRPWITERAIVVMPDHLHALVSWSQVPLGRDASLGRLVAQFKSESLRELRAKGLIRSWDCFWQGGFWDVVIRNETQLRRVERYIIENPLRAGRVHRLR